MGGGEDEINLAYTALPAKIKIWIFIQLAMRSHWKLLGRKWHFQSAFRKRMMAAMERGGRLKLEVSGNRKVSWDIWQ